MHCMVKRNHSGCWREGKRRKIIGRGKIGSCVPTTVGRNSTPRSGNDCLWLLQGSHRSPLRAIRKVVLWVQEHAKLNLLVKAYWLWWGHGDRPALRDVECEAPGGRGPVQSHGAGQTDTNLGLQSWLRIRDLSVPKLGLFDLWITNIEKPPYALFPDSFP